MVGKGRSTRGQLVESLVTARACLYLAREGSVLVPIAGRLSALPRLWEQGPSSWRFTAWGDTRAQARLVLQRKHGWDPNACQVVSRANPTARLVSQRHPQRAPKACSTQSEVGPGRGTEPSSLCPLLFFERGGRSQTIRFKNESQRTDVSRRQSRRLPVLAATSHGFRFPLQRATIVHMSHAFYSSRNQRP